MTSRVSNPYLKHAAAMIPFFAVVVALVVPTSEPIVRRADRPDSSYCRLAATSKALVSIGRAGYGALVAPSWALAAGHVARSLSAREAGTYGAIDVFTRVSTHVAWIESVMKSSPEKHSHVPATSKLSISMKLRFAMAVLLPNVAG